MIGRWDGDIALTAWLVSLCVAPFGLFSVPLIAATTINLWHQRRTQFNAGEEFTRRVHGVIEADLQDFDDRISAFEKTADDIKDSQVKIAGAFRGRQLPT